ncbi:uncharacterized protein LOC126996929 isoform X2 [Eriocheir sinensis]|uniref:uncharacterized protein LOC126996929 isoform X2 n=1 Tax=Eriocheir sinensis TaxID=95602 RepID=UPI0021C6A108|nr:uncharacterized protein LOC126996929 isoform X2 [Eriocheir sinensis]
MVRTREHICWLCCGSLSNRRIVLGHPGHLCRAGLLRWRRCVRESNIIKPAQATPSAPRPPVTAASHQGSLAGRASRRGGLAGYSVLRHQRGLRKALHPMREILTDHKRGNGGRSTAPDRRVSTRSRRGGGGAVVAAAGVERLGAKSQHQASAARARIGPEVCRPEHLPDGDTASVAASACPVCSLHSQRHQAAQVAAARCGSLCNAAIRAHSGPIRPFVLADSNPWRERSNQGFQGPNRPGIGSNEPLRRAGRDQQTSQENVDPPDATPAPRLLHQVSSIHNSTFIFFLILYRLLCSRFISVTVFAQKKNMVYLIC